MWEPPVERGGPELKYKFESGALEVPLVTPEYTLRPETNQGVVNFKVLWYLLLCQKINLVFDTLSKWNITDYVWMLSFANHYIIYNTKIKIKYTRISQNSATEFSFLDNCCCALKWQTWVWSGVFIICWSGTLPTGCYKGNLQAGHCRRYNRCRDFCDHSSYRDRGSVSENKTTKAFASIPNGRWFVWVSSLIKI